MAERCASRTREQAEREGDHVGEHVAGVGQQRERAGQDAADRLGEHVARGEREHDREPSLVSLRRSGTRRAVAVVVAHARPA